MIRYTIYGRGKIMKIVVIGLGSMGKRRIRLIQKFNNNYEIIGIDSNQTRCVQAKELYNIETQEKLEDALNMGADCAFICTSPSSHSSIINICLRNNLHIFTELNLINDGYQENMALSKEKENVLFLSSTFLYRDEVEYIKKSIGNSSKTLNYSYHVGQYLPDWHPWESFKDFFVSESKTNGCREIFAIELPWLIETFGEINSIKLIKGKKTGLELNYNDNYLLLIDHASGSSGMLAVDIMSRKSVRNLEIFGEDIYLSWDGSPTGLYHYDYDKKENINIKLYEELDTIPGYSAQIIENAYYKEVCNFFEVIKNEGIARYSFEKDTYVLALIDEIEKA